MSELPWIDHHRKWLCVERPLYGVAHLQFKQSEIAHESRQHHPRRKSAQRTAKEAA